MIALIGVLAGSAQGIPIVSTWPVAGGDESSAVAAAAFSGRYAVADSFEDTIEVRGIDPDVLIRSISRSEIMVLAAWMNLGGGPDGPSGMTWSDSGRFLFVLIHDDAFRGPGQASDVVLRYDAFEDEIHVFAELDLFNRGDAFPHLSAAHFRGRLYVGTSDAGIQIYRAARSDDVGVALGSLASGSSVRGLAIDRGNAEDHEAVYLYAADLTTVYRMRLDDPAPVFETIGSFDDIQAIAYSDHYGGSGNEGLYILDTSGLHHLTPAQARGSDPFAPTLYFAGTEHDVAATADGALLVGASEDALLLRDDTDPRLAFSDWIVDELDQLVLFAKGLVNPDGEPAGWVIDADRDVGSAGSGNSDRKNSGNSGRFPKGTRK